MREFKGIAVSPGISICEAYVIDSEDAPLKRKTIRPEEAEAEIKALRKAVEEASAEIIRIQDSAQIDEDNLNIFKFHLLMLKDPALSREIESHIRTDYSSAESAVAQVLRNRIEAVRRIDDDFFSQRDKDILDVKRRIISRLTGRKLNDLDHLARPVVVIAHDLTPSQTVTIPQKWVLGFVTEAGGRTSHTALIARNMGIPAVVGLGQILQHVEGGDLVIVDGSQGLIIVDPDDDVLDAYRHRQREFTSHGEAIRKQLKSLPAETADGYRVKILANIEFPEEIEIALDHGAEGIGLFRTEFIWATTPFPTVEDHLAIYKKAVIHLKDRPLTIRTFDMGADKVFEGMGTHQEPNPFLGLRSLRLCFRHLEMFKDQLRAILITSYFGNVKILFPMISSVEELDRALEILEEVKDELLDRGQDFDTEIEVGAMIEVPAAAIIAEELARRVTFFSIGTNDLIQYCLAVDRNNETVADLYQPAHPAVLKLIAHVLKVGEKVGIDVAMCGEMSGDLKYAILLLGMGLRELSIAPAMVSDIKNIIRQVTMDRARGIWREIATFNEASRAEERLAEVIARVLPQESYPALVPGQPGE